MTPFEQACRELIDAAHDYLEELRARPMTRAERILPLEERLEEALAEAERLAP